MIVGVSKEVKSDSHRSRTRSAPTTFKHWFPVASLGITVSTVTLPGVTA